VDALGRCERWTQLVEALTHAHGVGTFERRVPLKMPLAPYGSAGSITRAVCRLPGGYDEGGACDRRSHYEAFFQFRWGLQKAQVIGCIWEFQSSMRSVAMSTIGMQEQYAL
jgi:hypothetical protein